MMRLSTYYDFNDGQDSGMIITRRASTLFDTEAAVAAQPRVEPPEVSASDYTPPGTCSECHQNPCACWELDQVYEQDAWQQAREAGAACSSEPRQQTYAWWHGTRYASQFATNDERSDELLQHVALHDPC